jgi:hypothetical protein
MIAGLPSNLAAFTLSLARMVDYNCRYLCGPNQYIEIMATEHAFHEVARNKLASQAQGDWLFQIDMDHNDVVTGLYLHRRPPYSPTIWHWVDDESTNYAFLADWPKGEIMEIGVAGAGCLLVRNKVFKRMYDELGEQPFSTKEFKTSADDLIGEDFAFFRRCRKLGIRVCCPTYVECHHLEVRALGAETDYNPDSMGGPANPKDRLRRAGAVAAVMA